MSRNRIWIYLIPLLGITVVAIGLYLALSSYEASGPSARDGLLILADQNLRNPLETPEIEHESGVIGRFQRRTGERVHTQYGPSAVLSSSVAAGAEADLLLVDEYSMELVRKAGLILHERTVARLIPVILVGRENPRNISELADLAGPGIRLVLPDVRSTVMGKIAAEVLEQNGVDVGTIENPPLITDSVMEAVRTVGNRRADATIVWRPFAGGFSHRTLAIDIPEEQNRIIRLEAAVPATSKNREMAVRLADFVASPAGQEVFEMYGYDIDVNHHDTGMNHDDTGMYHHYTGYGQ